MPQPYAYFDCADFPELSPGAKMTSTVQLHMPWADEEATTTLTAVGIIGVFERHDVVHQTLQDIDAIYKGQALRRLIVNVRFRLYFNRHEKYLVLQTDKRTARDALRRITDSRLAIQTNAGEVDLQRFAAAAVSAKTTGGWFANYK